MITKEQAEQLRELIKEERTATAEYWAGSSVSSTFPLKLKAMRKAGQEVDEYIRYLSGENQRIGS